LKKANAPVLKAWEKLNGVAGEDMKADADAESSDAEAVYARRQLHENEK